MTTPFRSAFFGSTGFVAVRSQVHLRARIGAEVATRQLPCPGGTDGAGQPAASSNGPRQARAA